MADIPRVPVATYRLQFRNGMTFDRAVEIVPYLRSLGISHLYASPIFTAVSGSTHGYDVTDPNAIEPDLGGIDGFRRLSDTLLAAGLGLILDIVPNHMAASLENPYWRDVLKWGRDSRFAGFFDNDWSQKLTLPVLDRPIEEAITAGDGKLRWADAGEIVFDYHGSPYPLTPSTYPLALSAAERTDRLVSEMPAIIALLEQQPWRLIHWRDAAGGLSYRRFFEITGLVGVRVEDAAIFDATHQLVLELVAEGRVQGLRVDHIDGLADPAAYLKRLRQAIGADCYLVVEKILEGDEQLPSDWPVDGTTGYEFIADLAGLLTADSPALDRAWREVAPDFDTPEHALGNAKRLMVEVNFEGEIRALAQQAQTIADSQARRDLSGETLAAAVRALVTGFDVYRTYGTADGLGAQDARVVEALFRRLRGSCPTQRHALAFLEDVLLGRVDEARREGATAFRTRLQHLTGPVLAKSLEDTFFYRYNRLIALNEVGGDPVHGGGGLAHFHRRMTARHNSQPRGLSTTSTHDTKRGEDARARLYAISEAPEEWIAATERWRQALAPNVVSLGDGPAPEPSVEWLIFQALAGMLPHDFDPSSTSRREEIRRRFLPYVEKALREAKLRTNWSDVNQGYEQAVSNYAASAIASGAFMATFWTDIRPYLRTGMINSLVQTHIKLTAPGIPDIYQGAEAADNSLVDPDNRRVPDFQGLSTPDIAPSPDNLAATKTWLIRRILALRGHYPGLFTLGDYVPLESSGARSANVVAFARRHEGEAVVVAAPRLVHEAVLADTLLSDRYWGDTTITLPAGLRSISDALGGIAFPATDRLTVASLFRSRPVALLLGKMA